MVRLPARTVGEAHSLPLARSALGSLFEGAAERSEAEGFTHSINGQTPPPHVRSAPPLPWEARVLRTGGRRVRSTGCLLESGVAGG